MSRKPLLLTLIALLGLLIAACDKGETRTDAMPASGADSAPKEADKAPMADKAPAEPPAEYRAEPDHSALDALLKKFVTPEGGVKYADWKADADSLKALGDYVAWVEGADPSKMSDKQRLAFYINAYNATTLKAVLDRYPLKSVMDTQGFFDGIKHKVAGDSLTLNELEGEKIRKPFGEPRIHFVVNCASASCPILRRDALTEDNLEALMDEAAKAYVLQETKVDAAKKTVDTSKIFEWYKDDFTPAGGVNAFLAKYLPADQAEVVKAATVTTHEYGWSLNEAK
jgi:hypothetical protein